LKRERERERERERGGGRERERERERVCVCVLLFPPFVPFLSVPKQEVRQQKFSKVPSIVSAFRQCTRDRDTDV